MNGSIIMIGVVAAMSIVFLNAVFYHVGSLVDDITFLLDTMSLRKHTTLEEDFRDILEFIPLTKIRLIINDYLKYDLQINNMVNFIEDQRKFIAKEFQQMPQLASFSNILRENGLEVDNWIAKIQDLWKTKVTFVQTDPNIATGGLTVMIQKILNIVPKNELHEFLRKRTRYSSSLRGFLKILKSTDFINLCETIDKNVVLQQHIFWAEQEDIEIRFALELLRNLYCYVTEEIQ